MLLYGSDFTKKTSILIENYLNLLNSGVPSDDILVIIQNSKLKNEWINEVKKGLKIPAVSKFNVYSFFGLCYNFVSDYYPFLEEKIKYPLNTFFPNLCGLEASTKIFNDAIKKLVFKGYNSKVNLLHQLLRRQSLITLNALSDDEITDRTRVLRESFTNDSKNAINMYRQKTLEYRAFDYLRQVNLFSYLYKKVKNPYKYVFVDDADEITPALFEYLKFIKNDIKEFYISYDTKGTTRKGYLCGSENNFELFLNETPKIIDIETDRAKIADNIFENIKSEEPVELNNLTMKDFIRADEMTDSVIEDINELINKGVKPNEILIIIPENDPYLKLYFEKIAAPVNFITGSEKIENNRTVSALLSVARLLIENENYKISTYKLRGLLMKTLDLKLDLTIKIAAEYESDFNTENIFAILAKYKDEGKIQELLTIKEKMADRPLSKILYELARIFIEKIPENKENIRKINELLKQITDFEEIFNREVSKSELLSRLENTIIAENPLSDNEFDNNAINISTPQKAIDFKLKNKYLFILNASSSAWMRQDSGPLYNAWVFQKSWNKKEFTLEDSINFSLDKIARTLRKLFLLQTGEIKMYSSVYNWLGAENLKGIKHLFDIKREVIHTPVKKIIPRDDQKDVLEYNKGKFAVMAVAGAGKTTIMLALIIKLLEQGVKAENIFVLTYMDSAARTFKERIKAFFPDLSELPNISTIHGLSMRILRENNNHAHLGLDVDFDIIDEIKRLKLITEIVFNEGGDTQKASVYEKAISAFKNSKNKNPDFLKPVFKRIYLQYQRALKELNLIDYDDLLILALELLKTNSKIREYYINLAHYVIEDEAQDSSEIQQELINIISKKSGNIIRCGDVNQAITSTFTNSDTKGFKRFIENNPNCKMNYTARNSTGVIKLANKLIKKGLEIAPASFLEIETKPVRGKNIIDENACEMKIFENEEEEKNYLTEKIKSVLSNEKNVSIGILTRTNNEVEELTEYLKYRINCKIQTKSDLISTNPIFKAVLGVFNFLSNPLNNNHIYELLKTMMEIGFYTKEMPLLTEIKNSESPFIFSKKEESPFFWDIRYFLQLSAFSPPEAAFKIGEFYFINDKKRKSNIAPMASITAKIFNAEGNFEDCLNKLNNMKQKSSFSTIKLFEEKDDKEENEAAAEQDESTISVLTLHKSKGDEFDYVFIPYLTDINLGLKQSEIKLKEGTKIIKEVQRLNKTDEDLKQEIIDENLRLLYVGITRSRRKLYMTASCEYKFKNKIKKCSPSYCFELLGGNL